MYVLTCAPRYIAKRGPIRFATSFGSLPNNLDADDDTSKEFLLRGLRRQRQLVHGKIEDDDDSYVDDSLDGDW